MSSRATRGRSSIAAICLGGGRSSWASSTRRSGTRSPSRCWGAGGTDAPHLQRLGIECFGFNPLLLPPEMDFWSLFHGIDERVPVASLEFSAKVLDDLLGTY